MSTNNAKLQTTWIALSVMAASGLGAAAEAQVLDSAEVASSSPDITELGSVTSSLVPQSVAQASVSAIATAPEATSPALTPLEKQDSGVSASQDLVEPVAAPSLEPDLVLAMEDMGLETIAPDITIPETATAETVSPETVSLNPANAETVSPVSITPDIVSLEIETPDIVSSASIPAATITPEAITPESINLEIARPDIVIPEIVSLETASPEPQLGAKPQVQAPHESAVESQAGEMQSQARETMELQAADTQLQAADTPTPQRQITAQGLEALEERLRQLEERQQDLLEEIDDLKGQLQDQATEREEEAIATDSDIDIKSSDRPQGLYLSGEVLLLEPTPGDNLDFAITDPGVALTTSGQVQSVDYEQQANTRVGVGYRKGDVDVRATFLKIQSDGQTEAERPTPGFLFSTLTHPAQNDQADRAKATAELTYNTTDLEVGYALQTNDQIDLRLSAGLRFADTDQQLKVEYDGVDFTNAEAKFEHDFAGFGPKLGADLRWKLGSGFSAFGRASGSLLMGDAKTSYRETDNDGTTLVAEVIQRDSDRIIPVAEMAIGLDWTGQLTDNLGLSLAGGYEYQNWFNAFNNIQFVDNASPGVFTDSDEDMGFQGFFFKAGLSLDF